jgi:exosortase A-associated hydrolase 2
VETFPFFLQSITGNIFIALFKNKVIKSKTVYILVPPFLDEMNKSRRMFAKMANILVVHGYDALMPDFYGTGDSEGEFVDADWEVWRSDFDHLITWCETQNYQKINFIALRSGALFLLDYLSCHKNIVCEKLILWHPTTNGDNWLTQFLRLHLAANLSAGNDKETTKSLKSRIVNGESIEIAGYELSAKLANKIKSIKLIEKIPANVPQVFWVDVVGTEGNGMLPASEKVIDHWKQKSVSVDAETVVGPAFWSAVEIVDVEALTNQTQAYIFKNK